MGSLGAPEPWGPWARAQRAHWIRRPWIHASTSSTAIHDYPVVTLMFRKLNATQLPSSATASTAVLKGCSHSSAKEKQTE